MTRNQKKTYNQANEGDYYFAPFTEQRRELRKEWGTTRRDWESFLYDREKKHQNIQITKN